MKALNTLGAAVSLTFMALGFWELWKFGLNMPGALLCFVPCVCGLALSLTLFVFNLRARIARVEQQQASR